MADEKMNLYQKLAKIRKLTEVLQKNKEGYGYTYVTEDAILEKVTTGMEEQHISLIPRLKPGTVSVSPVHFLKTKSRTDKVTKETIFYEEHQNEFLLFGEMEWEWVNDENPSEKLIIPWVLVGQQGDASQTFGSALTYTTRYFLLKYFNVATSDDDPDEYKRRKAEIGDREQKAILDAMLEQIATLVEQKVNDTNKAVVKKAILKADIVRENGKPSNKFTLIREVEAATKYLDVLQQALGMKSEKKNETKEEE